MSEVNTRPRDTRARKAAGVVRLYPDGYAGAWKTWPQIALRSDVRALDPEFRKRVHAMMREAHKQGVAVGIGGGGRTTAQQTTLFLSRHYPDPSGSIYWNGQRWSRKAGVAAAAPPGLSWHETAPAPLGGAIAVDAVGDLNWVGKNAGWFGLKDFSDVNSEAWHLQPVELPNSRSAWDRVTGLRDWFVRKR